jgi:thiaminase (transcriptional activator TenA)
MVTSQDFWERAAPLIAVTEKHPFLVAMVDGTLDMENFRYYVVQDALYLKDFADSLRMLSKNEGIDKADSDRLEAFAVGAEEAELCLHNSFFKQWEISAEGVEQMPHSLLYTSYMKRIVATRPHAEGLAVLLPCFWVYAHVGETMLKLRTQLGDAYVNIVEGHTTPVAANVSLCTIITLARLYTVSSDLHSSMPGSTCTVATTLPGK